MKLVIYRFTLRKGHSTDCPGHKRELFVHIIYYQRMLGVIYEAFDININMCTNHLILPRGN